MNIFINLFFKELKLLLQDKIGLLALFVMPAALIITVTCVQNVNYTKSKKNTLVSLLVISPNSQRDQIEYKELESKKTNGVQFITASYPVSADKINDLLKKHDKKAALILPENSFSRLNAYIKGLVNSDKVQKPKIDLELFYGKDIDAILGNIQLGAVKNLVQEAKNEILLENLIKYADNSNINKGSFDNIVFVNEQHIKNSQQSIPSPIQQNIPAWTIFGMFFILIPLSSTLIKERETKVLLRLFTTPMNAISFLGSKILAYFIVNMIQLVFMLFIGIKILPLFGIEKFIIGNSLVPIFIVGIFVSLAAIGFGMIIGILAKTHQQASTIGPILVVIASAIGGIMVPIYLMPENIRFLSTYSPLNWGQKAFLSIISKQESLLNISNDLGKLLFFFIICFIISLIMFKRGTRK